MPQVQLRLGDMFDGPSDLIVLPCSTAGTITSFVREKLVHHRIPYPKPGMELGDVHVLPFEGGENIAQFVAFAASVEGDHSSTTAIERIGVQLGECTRRGPTVRLIAAPLLGAGAGGLRSEAVVKSLNAGFKSAADEDATLTISVLHREVFERIRGETEQMRGEHIGVDARREERGKPRRVFVSYSHTSPDHQQWVESIATFLRQNGIDARLDVWHLRRGMDLPQWMTNELALAERVVLVSDERYAEKADGRVGGIGWETMIVQGDMSQLPPDSVKYLVVVHCNDIDQGLPKYLRTKFVIHWPGPHTDTANRKLLLRELLDRVAAPPLGPVPIEI
jgi:hypothetical protein